MIRLCGACDGLGVIPRDDDPEVPGSVIEEPCRECDGAGVKETDGAVDYPQPTLSASEDGSQGT